MADHVRAMLDFQRGGAVTFDYGNNIRTFAQDAGVEDAFDIPGFVPAFIRPLFCEGRGPFRVAALSGDPADIARIDRALCRAVPRRRSASSAGCGWPPRRCRSRACPRASAGSATASAPAPAPPSTTSSRSGEVSAPIVIGRDHLDAGSVASPYRETEAMRDGSDAIADWPILNALVNTAAGATWVSFHHGGGVGIGYSLHAGMVVVADGTPEAAARLERVLTSDPGMGVIRHADAGYERALEVARERGVRIPMDEAPDRWTGSPCSSSSRTSCWHSRWWPAWSAGGFLLTRGAAATTWSARTSWRMPRHRSSASCRRSGPLVVLVGLVTAWAQGYPWLGLTTGWMLLTVLLDPPDPRALIPTIFIPRGRVFEAEMAAARARVRSRPELRAAWADRGRRDGPSLRARGDGADHRGSWCSSRSDRPACPTMRPCDAT